MPVHSRLSTKARLHNATDVQPPACLAALSFQLEIPRETLKIIFHKAASGAGPLVSWNTVWVPFFSVRNLRVLLRETLRLVPAPWAPGLRNLCG